MTHPVKENIQLSDTVNDFCRHISHLSNTKVGLCWHCKSCSSGCPFSWAMDLYPNQVLRLVQLGLKQEALRCSSIWICVGCHTCSVQCPMAIDMAAVMDTLRHMALEEKVPVAEPDIYNFHREVVNSISRYGRTHKLEIMLRYKLQKRDWFSDMDVGLQMLAHRKLDLVPSKVKAINKLRNIIK